MSGKDVLRAKAMKKKNKTLSESTSKTEDDMWDDSVLVEAFNKAVEKVQAKVSEDLPKSPTNTNTDEGAQKIEWNVGDFCRCEFSEDHIYYEANIIEKMDDLGMCIVKYLGYENEERVPLDKLQPSEGELARTNQMKQAEQDKAAKSAAPVDNNAGQGNPPESGKKKKKKNTPKKQENVKANETAATNDKGSQCPTSSDMFQQTFPGAIPPPPPPHMMTKLDENAPESDAMGAMLMSWYMSGYHTGYYQGLKAAKK